MMATAAFVGCAGLTAGVVTAGAAALGGAPASTATDDSSAATETFTATDTYTPTLPTVEVPVSVTVEPTQDSGALVLPIAFANGDTPSAAAIPTPALAAYQRAEAVLAGADDSCGLSWTLLAAVGETVSRHGGLEGYRLTENGVVRPALVGGYARDDSGRVSDTDAGELDEDKRWDRAVGPMSLPPATWSVVGVDANGDDIRNPQDITDAALAVAVLLCAGEEDLRTREGRTSAVARLSPDPGFVQRVLSVDEAFASEEATSATESPTVVPADAPTSSSPSDAVEETSAALTALAYETESLAPLRGFDLPPSVTWWPTATWPTPTLPGGCEPEPSTDAPRSTATPTAPCD